VLSPARSAWQQNASEAVKNSRRHF